MTEEKTVRIIFVQVVERPPRKLLLKRGIKKPRITTHTAKEKSAARFGMSYAASKKRCTSPSAYGCPPTWYLPALPATCKAWNCRWIMAARFRRAASSSRCPRAK